MGHWSNTTFLHFNRPRASEGVFEALKAIFGKDGYEFVPGKVALTPELTRQMQYAATETEPTVWGAAFVPGKGEWHVLKTAPLRLMVKPGHNMISPRLSHLSRMLQCHALSVHVDDGVHYLIAECDESGNTYLSGGTSQEDELGLGGLSEFWTAEQRAAAQARYARFLESLKASAGEPGSRPPHKGFYEPFFLRPEFNVCMERARAEGGMSEQVYYVADGLTGLEWHEWDNTVLAEYLIPGKPIRTPGPVSWYFRRS